MSAFFEVSSSALPFPGSFSVSHPLCLTRPDAFSACTGDVGGPSASVSLARAVSDVRFSDPYPALLHERTASKELGQGPLQGSPWAAPSLYSVVSETTVNMRQYGEEGPQGRNIIAC